MNLKHLSDDTLLSETKRLAREEQSVLARLLHHIKEVERRRLFCTLKYQSINQYVERELGYSSDEAWRRVSSSRLLNEIPELAEKISEGKLNLTTLGMAQALFQKEKRQVGEPFSLNKKKEVLQELENKSSREAAKVLWSHSSLPTPVFREQVRVLDMEMCEYNFAADQETRHDIERLKGLLAHVSPGMTTGELIKKLCKLGLKEWDPALQTAAPRPKRPKYLGLKQRASRQTAQPRPASPSNAEISRQTWRSAQSKCANCGSYFALQEDHRFPKAKGGGDGLENKRLLCRNCNQRAAIEHFGQSKMDLFLKSPVVEYSTAATKFQNISVIRGVGRSGGQPSSLEFTDSRKAFRPKELCR